MRKWKRDLPESLSSTVLDAFLEVLFEKEKRKGKNFKHLQIKMHI